MIDIRFYYVFLDFVLPFKDLRIYGVAEITPFSLFQNSNNKIILYEQDYQALIFFACWHHDKDAVV